MSETRTVRLGDYCHKIEKITSKNFSDESFQYVDLSSIDNKKKIITRASKILTTEAPSRAKQILKKGDILVSTVRPNLNAVAVVPGELDGCIGSTGFSVLRPTDELDPVYLFSWVCSPTFVNSMVNLATGASYPAISDRVVKDSLIPLPPLEEQKKIAAEFTLTRLISQKRERQQELFEELKSSLFQSMLDDDNETVNLGDVASFIGGSSLPTGEPFTGQEGGVLLMKVSDMNAPGNKHKIHHTSLWVSKHGNENQIVPAGSVVIPKRGASIATNKKRLITRPTALDPNLMAVTPKSEKLTSQFLYHWFLQFDLTSITSGSSVPQLNKKDLSPLEISIPSFQHQINFARIIDTIKY